MTGTWMFDPMPFRYLKSPGRRASGITDRRSLVLNTQCIRTFGYVCAIVPSLRDSLVVACLPRGLRPRAFLYRPFGPASRWPGDSCARVTRARSAAFKFCPQDRPVSVCGVTTKVFGFVKFAGTAYLLEVESPRNRPSNDQAA